MTRIASEDHTEVRFCPNGFGVDRRAVSQIDMTAGAALDRGTLMLETRMSPNGKPQVLFGYYRVFPWSRAFSIQIIPRGAITLVHSDHGDVCHAAFRWRGTGRADVIRIIFRGMPLQAEPDCLWNAQRIQQLHRCKSIILNRFLSKTYMLQSLARAIERFPVVPCLWLCQIRLNPLD